MRAACEACGGLQPLDWTPGEPCVHCGRAVRRDVRCFWCAKWTPFARFCRSCGAEVVEETRYGPARMLKDAGTDRFTIPKMLRELDPDQVENFARIYARHAAAVARHVDDLRFVERSLFHKHWSAALEDELIPLLPLPEARLHALSGPPRPAADDRATLRAIQESSPFARTRRLAALARVRLDDWEALKEARTALFDEDLAPEAALVLTGWRVDAVGRSSIHEERVIERLGQSSFRLESAVRLGQDAALLEEALDSKDPETAFAAALALGDVDRLAAALSGDDLTRIAAGRKLAERGAFGPLRAALRESTPEVQAELVEALARQERPAPALREALLSFVENAPDRIRERAARVLARDCDPAVAMRIARATDGDRDILRSLLSVEAALPPEAVAGVLAHQVEIGRFSSGQWGLDDAVKRGAVPFSFVPDQFDRASGDNRKELLRLAEQQLSVREDEALHRFVLAVVFGPHEAPVRAAAWWSLHRWYRSLGEHRGEGPFRLERASAERFFGSVDAFVPRLAALLRDPASLKEVGLYEFLAHLFGSAEPELATPDLVRALLEAVRGDLWPYLIDSMIDFLGRAGTDPRWRDEVIAGLEGLGKKGNYHREKALRALRCSVHGLPDEPEWPKLPAGFVPERFVAATAEGRQALLRVAEQQLIHGEHPSLLRFLLEAALGPHEAEARIGAMKIWSERGGRAFHLDREHAAGPFLRSVAAALTDDAVLCDRPFRAFLSGLLEHPSEEAARAADGSFVRALLACAGRESDDRLRHRAIQWVGRLGAEDRWRGEAVAGLERLAASLSGSLAASAKNALRELRPPLPEMPVPRPVRGVPDEHAAKAKEAERLGKELQEAALRISFGPGTPEEKTREVMRLQAEFQDRLRKLYAP